MRAISVSGSDSRKSGAGCMASEQAALAAGLLRWGLRFGRRWGAARWHGRDIAIGKADLELIRTRCNRGRADEAAFVVAHEGIAALQRGLVGQGFQHLGFGGERGR